MTRFAPCRAAATIMICTAASAIVFSSLFRRQQARVTALCLGGLCVFLAGGRVGADGTGEAASRQGAFATRQAYDALAAAQGTKNLQRQDTGALAWGESYVMMSFVIMYEATGDTAYLDHLIEHADLALEQRDSIRGIRDYRGRSLPGWSIGGPYSIGELRLNDAAGAPSLYLRSSLTGSNDQTEVSVERDAERGTFTLRIHNPAYRQEAAFDGLTMDPEADSYAISRIRASALADPYGAMRLYAEDLGSPAAGVARQPLPLQATMETSRYLWPVHQGMILEPLTFFARTVLQSPRLGENPRYRDRADAYLAAAEALFHILEEGWRENDAGEGWYEIEKGAPVWLDGCDEPHNHYLAVGAAMLHAAAVRGGQAPWADRVRSMARTIRNDMRHVPDGDRYVWPYWWSKGRVYNGWKPEDGVSRNTPGRVPRTSVEDFSHGSIEINFAYRCYRDGIVFTRTDIERLANTFEQAVLRRTEDGSLTFSNRVDGSGGVGRYDRLGPAWPLLAEVRPAILEIFCRMRQDAPWNGYSPWLLQSATMNLVRQRLAGTGDTRTPHQRP